MPSRITNPFTRVINNPAVNYWRLYPRQKNQTWDSHQPFWTLLWGKAWVALWQGAANWPSEQSFGFCNFYLGSPPQEMNLERGGTKSSHHTVPAAASARYRNYLPFFRAEPRIVAFRVNWQ